MKTIVVVAFALAALMSSGCSIFKSKPEAAAPAAASKSAAPAAVLSAPASVKKEMPASPAKEPSAYGSLQPFKKFKKGDGLGVAIEYKPRTKAQFIALLRDKKLAKKEMRVSCEVLVHQMVEAHPGLPFEGCEGAAAALASDDYQVVSCRDEMFLKDSWLTVTDPKGSSFGIWHRKCLPKERVLTYKGRVLASTMCLNAAIPLPKAQSSPKPAPVFATDVCPNGFTLIANAWSLASLPSGILLPGLKEEAESLMYAADHRQSKEATSLAAYRPGDVSRTLGKRLREEVKIHAPIAMDVPVRFLDPVTAKLVREVGVISGVRGVGSYHFSGDPRSYVIETVWPIDFGSPALSGGERRLRVFPDEWQDLCTINLHGILP